MMKHIYPDNILGGAAIYQGFTLGDILYYTTPGADTFVKADYPGLRALLIEAQGAGGGSGGNGATGAGQSAVGGGGGGGGYARSLVLATDLDETEAVTVGAGGTAGTTTPGNGGAGGNSVFDTISGEVRGNGGSGGGSSTAFTPLTGVPGSIGAGGSGVGDLVIPGGDANPGFALAQNRLIASTGGGSVFSGVQSRSLTSGAPALGEAGKLYGGGAGGTSTAQSLAAAAGAVGADGIVIVWLLY